MRRRSFAQCGGWLGLGVVLLWSLQGLPQALAQVPAQVPPRARAAEVKAAYVARFLGYAEWPSSVPPPAPAVVGVVGDDEVAEVLGVIAAERREGQRPLEVRRCVEGEALPAALHVLFVGRGQPVAEWVRRVQGRAVLTVSDDPRGLDGGSMLNLLQSEGRIRFEASLPALQAGGIKFSARALTLAERVVGVP